MGGLLGWDARRRNHGRGAGACQAARWVGPDEDDLRAPMPLSRRDRLRLATNLVKVSRVNAPLAIYCERLPHTLVSCCFNPRIRAVAFLFR